MAHIYKIVDAKPVHLSMVARRLRAGDLEEIEAAGETPRHLLFRLWRNSTHRWAAYVDGEIACVGGCAGPLASDVGEPWLFTTAAIERVPMAFARESQGWLREVLTIKRRLTTACLANYEKSLRLWTMLGFRVGDTIVYPNGAQFRQLIMER